MHIQILFTEIKIDQALFSLSAQAFNSLFCLCLMVLHLVIHLGSSRTVARYVCKTEGGALRHRVPASLPQFPSYDRKMRMIEDLMLRRTIVLMA